MDLTSKWKTKGGELIPIKDLTNDHLFNIWNMIRGKVYRRSCGGLRADAERFLQGDMALHSIEEHFDDDGYSTDDENPYVYSLHLKFDDIYREVQNRLLIFGLDADELSAHRKRLKEYVDQCNARDNMDWLPLNNIKQLNK